MEAISGSRIGKRVSAKRSPNGKITVFLGKRDFVDHHGVVDPINGVVLLDPEYVNDLNVFAEVQAYIRYGPEEIDVLRFAFEKDLHILAEQIYPQLDDSLMKPLTKLQRKVLLQLGSNNAFPFYLEVPSHWPTSVALYPGMGIPPCSVEYAVRAFVAQTPDHKPLPGSSVVMPIRRLMGAPDRPWVQPSVEVFKTFVFSRYKLYLEVSLEKELYHKGEPIPVSIQINNFSNRTVQKIKVAVYQFASPYMFSGAHYRCSVAKLKTTEGCPVKPGSTLSKVCVLTPLAGLKGGLALDGRRQHGVVNLASSTIVVDAATKEELGIIVQYKVKVKLYLGLLGGHLSAELPFVLMHPKPEDVALPTFPRTNHPEEESEILVHYEQDDESSFDDFVRLRVE